MKIQSLLKLLAPVAALASTPLFADAPGEPIRIENIAFKGTGCPDNSTASVNISDDKQAFTVAFSEFVAETGPGLPLTAGRKNCNLTLDLDIPAGWQFSIASFNFRGFAAIDEGVSASHEATYFLQGDRRQQKFSSTENGPAEKDYVYTDNIGISSAVWSACGVKRALSVNTVLRVWNTDKNRFPNSAGILTNDTIDGEIVQKYGITWRRCS